MVSLKTLFQLHEQLKLATPFIKPSLFIHWENKTMDISQLKIYWKI